MANYRLLLKAVEIILSIAFLFLCAKAFCSHFYSDLKGALRRKRQHIAFIEAAPSIVSAVKVTAKPKEVRYPYKWLDGPGDLNQRSLWNRRSRSRVRIGSGQYLLGECAMTPKDCRAMADQCFQWVHDAKTADERRAYLKLAHVWLAAAVVEDDTPPNMPPASRLQIIRTRELPQLR